MVAVARELPNTGYALEVGHPRMKDRFDNLRHAARRPSTTIGSTTRRGLEAELKNYTRPSSPGPTRSI